MSLLSATTLNGTDVKNSKGENLGDIKDLMIDLASGRVAYAVVEFGGLFGIGSKLFAVPLLAMSKDADNECFVLDTTKEALEQSPGFDKDKWPNFADLTWQEEVHKHYNTPPYWR